MASKWTKKVPSKKNVNLQQVALFQWSKDGKVARKSQHPAYASCIVPVIIRRKGSAKTDLDNATKSAGSIHYLDNACFLTEVSKENPSLFFNFLIMQTCLNSLPRGVEPRSAGCYSGTLTTRLVGSSALQRWKRNATLGTKRSTWHGIISIPMHTFAGPIVGLNFITCNCSLFSSPTMSTQNPDTLTCHEPDCMVNPKNRNLKECPTAR
jgi:hypothetical protein